MSRGPGVGEGGHAVLRQALTQTQKNLGVPKIFTLLEYIGLYRIKAHGFKASGLIQHFLDIEGERYAFIPAPCRADRGRVLYGAYIRTRRVHMGSSGNWGPF